MPRILPDPTDAQVEARHFTCPNCGDTAVDATTYPATDETLRSVCLCIRGHIWTVHWLVNA